MLLHKKNETHFYDQTPEFYLVLKHEPVEHEVVCGAATSLVCFLSCRLPYYQYFGGVSSLSKEQYLKINGFPNNYWGWGGEDDDIYNRYKPSVTVMVYVCLRGSEAAGLYIDR